MTPFQKHKAQWIECRRCALCESRNRVVLCRGKIPAPIMFVGEAPGASEDVLGRPFAGPAGKLLDRIIDRAIDGQHDYCITNLIGCIPKMLPPTVVNRHASIFDMPIDRGGEWGNPYVLGKDGSRKQVIAMYREYLLTQKKLLAKLPTLAGKRLGCHCAPRPCHGDVIVELFRKLVPTDKAAEPPQFAIGACSLRLRQMQEMCKPKLIVYVGKLAEQHTPRSDKWETVAIIHPAAILRMDVSQQGLAIQRSIVAIEDAAEDL